ncbi:acyltransferase family protein [Leuconostoc holzapfelii]|nr:acyltransferase family protein [Leuconostoc holzapfelii]
MGKRNSNIELLRVLAMFFITAHHFAMWGYFIGNDVHAVHSNIIWLQVIELFGKSGVALFMLITGYFALNPKPTIQKIWQLTNTVRLYALGIFTILLIVGQLQFNSDLFWRSVFPTLRGLYWFTTIYTIIYIFSGYMAKFLKQLTHSQAVGFISLMVLIFMILPTFFYGWGNSQLTDLIPVFYFGLYLRLYGISKRMMTLLKLLTGVAIVIAIGSLVVADVVGSLRPQSQAIAKATQYFVTGCSPLTFVIAAYIFSYTINLKPRASRVINWMGSSALAIYLIQDNEAFRGVLWQNIFHVRALADTMSPVLFIGYSALVVTMIVVGGILVDKLLMKVLRYPTQYLLTAEMAVTNRGLAWFQRMVQATGYRHDP